MLATASAVVTLAAAPTPAPTFPPLPFDSPGPAASNNPAYGLPQIGRTRAVAPACAATRDLVIPSFKAALAADKRYIEAAKPHLVTYAEVNADPNAGVSKTAAISLLDRDVSAMLEQTQTIAKALGDPRISASVTDPDVKRLRAAMQQLYAVQMARASALNEFVQREGMRDSREQIGSTNAFGGRDSNGQKVQITPPPIATPDVSVTPVPGMPVLHGATTGLTLQDRENMQRWANQVQKETRDRENAAAKTFYTVAQRCR